MNTQDKIKSPTNKKETSTGAETALSVGLSDEDRGPDFDATEFLENEEAICLFREFLNNRNIKIKNAADLAAAAFQFYTKPDRWACWHSITEGLKVDYGSRTISIFGSKDLKFKDFRISTEKQEVDIELMNLEDVEYLGSLLGREVKKYISEDTEAKHWSLVREWHIDYSSLTMSKEIGKVRELKPSIHHQHDFITIHAWVH